MRFGLFDISQSLGGVIAHKLKTPNMSLKKGHIIDHETLKQMKHDKVSKAYIALPDKDDLNENLAATTLAQSLHLKNCRISHPHHGRVNIYAEENGLFRVNEALINRLNEQTEDIGISTLADQTIVKVGQMLATIKVIPFFVSEKTINKLDQQCTEQLAMETAPFSAHNSQLIMTQNDYDGATTTSKGLKKITTSLASHLAPFDQPAIGQPQIIKHHVEDIEAALENTVQGDSDIIFILGASAIQDRHDVIPSAIERIGGTIIRFGMPVDPGNLLLLARHQQKWIIGLPGCVRSPKINGFDWILKLIYANQPIDASLIASLGVGGLLKESNQRPELRDFTRPSKPTGKIAAVILAAGQSKRMGEENKLLKPYHGKALIKHAVNNVKEAGIETILVVTGHQEDAIKDALIDEDVSLIHNSLFETGQASSIKAGIKHLPKDIETCFIVLGDMPLVGPEVYQGLSAAIDIANGQTIAAPTWQGKRGNPVLWHNCHFSELLSLEGDTGAKNLLSRLSESLVLVPNDKKSILVDIDTQDAFDNLRLDE